MKKLYYQIWDYNQLQLRTLPMLQFLRDKDFQIILVVPYELNRFIAALSNFPRLKNTVVGRQLATRSKYYREIQNDVDEIFCFAWYRWLFYIIKNILGKRKRFFQVQKEILELQLIPKINLSSADICYSFDGISYHLFNKALNSNAFCILESQAIHIDKALDIASVVNPKEESKTNLWWSIKQRKEAELAHAIVGYSNFQERSFREKLSKSEKPFLTIPISSRFPHKKKTKSVGGRVKFLFVGRVDTRKGINQLMSVWNQLQNYAELHIAGRVDISVNRQLANVNWYGFLYVNQVVNLFESCHVLVFPTNNDSFGMVVSEALSYNMPVITTSHCGAADSIIEGQTGFVYKDPFDERPLMEAMQRFINTPSLVKKFSLAISQQTLFRKEDEIQRGIVQFKRLQIK